MTALHAHGRPRARRARALGWLTALALAAPAVAPAATYQIDPVHSAVTFRIRHVVTRVPGTFDQFAGTIAFDPKAPAATKIEGTIQAASIDTKNEKRDKHLRSADFFDVEKHPTITFRSTKVTPKTDTTGTVEGELTIKGITKPVVLEAEFLGTGTVYDTPKAGFHATTTIDRKDFGIVWNDTLDSGGVVLGDEVQIDLAVEANLVPQP